ncbi:alpha/beta hydrolase [Sphingomicrobium flavum]|uniref:alpha/beta hydrolase n=1 Tax=Sphingomicrobium flavum TaxID=1229164 RepID=UPI0021ADE915|nr:lysophospholipase [Sphingomicrobium flavum]
MITLTLAAALAAHAMTPEEVEIAGPEGPLAGTLIDPAPEAPAILFIAGSGPTDRNGDSMMGVKGGAIRQLAEALGDAGIASLRTDKRGLAGSAAAIANPNAVVFEDYVADTRGWIDLLRERGKPCVWLAGHSEGSTIALLTAQDPPDICGLILIAGAGRPILDVMVDQLSAQLPPPMLEQLETAFASMKAGETVDPATVPAPLAPMFAPDLQRFMMSGYTLDPATLLEGIDLPVLIVQPGEDLQVKVSEGEALKAAMPAAAYVQIDGVNHVLKPVPAGDVAANMASYGDADLAIDPRVAAAIAPFVLPAK